MLNSSPGVAVADDLSANVYPMPLTATRKYDVEVGRVRKNDVFGERTLPSPLFYDLHTVSED